MTSVPKDRLFSEDQYRLFVIDTSDGWRMRDVIMLNGKSMPDKAEDYLTLLDIEDRDNILLILKPPGWGSNGRVIAA